MIRFFITGSHGRVWPWLIFCLAVLVWPVPHPVMAQQAAERSAVIANLMQDFTRARDMVIAGRAAEAVPILDRLVSVAPETPLFRFVLAEALLQVGQRDRARFHFEALRGARLSPADRAHVTARLEALATARRWSAYLSFGLVPQTNIGKRTGDDIVTIGGISFKLTPGSVAQSGTGLSYSAGLSRQWTPGPGMAAQAGLQASGFVYGDRQFNDMRLRAFATLRRQVRPNLVGELGLNQTQRYLGNRVFSHGPGVWLGAETRVSAATLLTARLQADHLTHPTARGLDGPRHGLSFGVRHQASPALAFTAQLAVDRTDARLASEAGRGASLSLGVRRSFAGGLMVGMDVTARRDLRDAQDPLFGVRRADTTTAVALRLNHREVRFMDFVPTLELRHERRASTVSLARFENTSFGVFLSRDF